MLVRLDFMVIFLLDFASHVTVNVFRRSDVLVQMLQIASNVFMRATTSLVSRSVQPGHTFESRIPHANLVIPNAQMAVAVRYRHNAPHVKITTPRVYACHLALLECSHCLPQFAPLVIKSVALVVRHPVLKIA